MVNQAEVGFQNREYSVTDIASAWIIKALKNQILIDISNYALENQEPFLPT